VTEPATRILQSMLAVLPVRDGVLPAADPILAALREWGYV